MATDHNWTWTILMTGGMRWHVHEGITLDELLKLFYAEGHQETEIEAIIRH